MVRSDVVQDHDNAMANYSPRNGGLRIFRRMTLGSHIKSPKLGGAGLGEGFGDNGAQITQSRPAYKRERQQFNVNYRSA